ncbi:uncharacterized protein LOC135107839 [Scylla paramamosain]|uniref:uncharacterized protein LOC135107839 n=1 Tax=Scylla paramamosain TaxID=85552 RepID=UPI003083D89C
MLRVPPPLPRWMNLLFPYTMMVWALLGGVMVLVGLTFYLLNLRTHPLSLARSFLVTVKVRFYSITDERHWKKLDVRLRCGEVRSSILIRVLGGLCSLVCKTCFLHYILLPSPPDGVLGRWATLVVVLYGWDESLGGHTRYTTSRVVQAPSTTRHLFAPMSACLGWRQGMVGQSVGHVPVSWVSRSFLGLWWFVMLVLDISYTCNLIAVLTVPVYSARIHSFEQLAQSDLRVCMLDYGEFVPEALLTSTDTSLATIGAKVDLSPEDKTLRFSGEEACVEQVMAGTHAHIETFSYLKILYRILGGNADVYHLKVQLYQGNLAFLFRKSTPWRHKFNMGLQRLVEAGLVYKWHSQIMDKFPAGKGERREREPTELTLGHLQSSFLILGLGAGLAVVIFLVEFFLYPRQASLAKPRGGAYTVYVLQCSAEHDNRPR